MTDPYEPTREELEETLQTLERDLPKDRIYRRAPLGPIAGFHRDPEEDIEMYERELAVAWNHHDQVLEENMRLQSSRMWWMVVSAALAAVTAWMMYEVAQ